MDDPQRIVKCGNLSLHTPGGFFKKRWHMKYLVLYDGSKSGVKRLELFDSEIKFKKQNPAKIIPLVDCVRVVTCQRNKTTYTFEVRTSDQFYLLAGQSFQDMNDWVNCLRLVAFGQQQASIQSPAQQSTPQHPINSGHQQQRHPPTGATTAATAPSSSGQQNGRGIDVLLEKRSPQTSTGSHRPGADYARSLDKITGTGGGQAPLVPTETHPALSGPSQRATTASQAAAAAASALAKTRQRQPSLLGSCKPQPPTDSPFIQQATTGGSSGKVAGADPLAAIGQLDTLTPTVRGQLISSAVKTPLTTITASLKTNQQQSRSAHISKPPALVQATLDEEEENMLYCSIEDNPSEHNYRVKVIETELSLRCQLKCYQLTASTTIDQQYEQLSQLNSKGRFTDRPEPMPPITFYQLIIGPQELTLLNDYAALTMKQQQTTTQQQQGLWSWPYQCIRRYGFDKDNCFMFEAGRKCTSGPGQFIVQTPKAYSIYQDVVKFVNELRSLSTTDVVNVWPAAGGAAPTDNKLPIDSEASGGRQQQTVVTQIPVTWTPTSATGAIRVDTLESRQQFFNTLRQLDSSGQSPAGQTTNKIDLSGQNPTITTTPTTTFSTNIAPDSISNHNKGTTTTTTATAAKTTTTSQSSLMAHQSGTSPSSTADALQSTKSSPVSSSSSPSATGKSCDSVPSPEETDESGYDQGDDSADKSKSRFKLMSAAARKRQAQDSMSSASSTSSGGSPGHSVSRRSNGAAGGHQPTNGQGPTKRPPLTAVARCQTTNTTAIATQTNTKTTTTGAQTKDSAALSQNQKLLGMLVGGNLGQPEDFEANLIRDVYSEITKLHAKFAVARGSAEDSLSNNSSNEESTNFSDQSGPSEQGEMANDSGMGGQSSEPMYSNLRIRRARIGGNRVVGDLDDDDEVDDDDDIDDDDRHFGDSKTYFNSPVRPQPHSNYQQQNQNQFNQQQRHNTNGPPYVQSGGFDYLSSLPRGGSIYPTILNPIPECGEVAPQKALFPNQSKSAMTSLGGAGGGVNVVNKTNNCNNRIRQTSGLSPKDDPKEFKSNSNQKSSNNQRSQVSGLLKSRLPTNHYVINDVQYAKISRNICSKYESCL